MLRLRVDEKNTNQILKHSVNLLNKGGIIAFPTETFYGLGAKFDMEDALKNLLILKKRPEGKGLPIIIGNRSLLSLITSHINDKALQLMEKFWPGPLTLILPAKETASRYITGGSHTVAVRIPGESFALKLARSAGFPITATSANPSGEQPAQDAETVAKYFGNNIDLLIDAGSTCNDLPSTIVDIRGEEINIIREGTIKKDLLDII